MDLLNVEGLDWLEDRTCLLGLTGSFAYGTNVEDSDRDYKGICIPPKEYYLGLKSFNEYNSSGGKNFRNTKDDIDINVLHINKFVIDATAGVPNNIELLFLRDQDYIKLTEEGKLLIKNRHLFLSKALKKKFGGYAFSQIQRMKHKKNRDEIVKKYGYDTKYFMHAVRLLTSAIEILETGDYTTYRPNREFLIECRNGSFTLEEAITIVEKLDERLEKLYEVSRKIPNKPDYNKINKLLIEINEQALNKSKLT